MNKKIEYTRAIVNFTYTFDWDITKINFNHILNNLTEEDKETWKKIPLYERDLFFIEHKINMQPTISHKGLVVLEKSEVSFDKEAILITKESNEILIFSLSYNFRIYENGVIICTFSIESNDPASLKSIHDILTLTSSLNHKISVNNVYIKNKKEYNLEGSERLYLVYLFNLLLKEKLPSVFDSQFKKIAFDFNQLKINASNNDYRINWQNPFVSTFLEVTKKSFLNFKSNDLESVKELMSIASRISLDDGNIVSESQNISLEYIYNNFGYGFNNKKLQLHNYSHHEDLFFNISKRGAIAITDSFESNPSYFILPSLLNLIEILRSRWHIGSIINLILDEILEDLSFSNEEVNFIYQKISKCRRLFGSFLKDPSPYLFDGGSITELSDISNKIFWIKNLESQMITKFKLIETLLNDIYRLSRIDSL